MFDANHFHLESTFDTADSWKVSLKHSSKDIYSLKLVVQVFPNLFPCVFIHINERLISNVCKT